MKAFPRQHVVSKNIDFGNAQSSNDWQTQFDTEERVSERLPRFITVRESFLDAQSDKNQLKAVRSFIQLRKVSFDSTPSIGEIQSPLTPQDIIPASPHSYSQMLQISHSSFFGMSSESNLKRIQQKWNDSYCFLNQALGDRQQNILNTINNHFKRLCIELDRTIQHPSLAKLFCEQYMKPTQDEDYLIGQLDELGHLLNEEQQEESPELQKEISLLQEIVTDVVKLTHQRLEKLSELVAETTPVTRYSQS